MAGEPVIKPSNADITLVSEQETFDQRDGWVLEQRWTGDLTKYNDLKATLLNAGAMRISSVIKQPVEITAHFPAQGGIVGQDEDTQAQANAVWELIPTEYEKDLASHGLFNKASNSAEAMADVQRALREDLAAATAKDWNATYPDATVGEFNRYVALYVKGVRSFLAYTWTVRQTIASSKASILKPASINVMKIVSYGEIDLPSAVKWDQPTVHYCVGYNEISGVSPGWADITITQWLKKPATVRWNKATRKYDLTQEWLGVIDGTSSGLYD